MDPVIAGVRDVDVAVGVHGHPVGTIELARSAALAAPLGQGLSGGRQLLDPVVAGVCDVDVPLRVEG